MYARHDVPRSGRDRSVSNGLKVVLGTVAALGALALVERRRARAAERVNPPIGRFMEVDGVRLHYLDRGRGMPIVLLHGNGSMLQDFTSCGLVDGLAAHGRVIVFDRPGFGYSSRPRGRLWTASAQARLISDALRRLGVDSGVMVGHSWGTLVALALAAERPDTVRSLVLMSGYYFPSARADVPAATPLALPGLGDALRWTVIPPVARLMMPKVHDKLFGPAPVPPHFRDFPMDLALRPGHLRAASEDTALMMPSAAKLSGGYRTVRVPTVILAGTDDRLVDTHAQSVRLHRVLPDSRLELVPGAGHMVHQIAPGRAFAAIGEAVRAVAPA